MTAAPSASPVRVTSCEPAIGNLFILGFQGLTPPVWLQRMAEQFGLGGVLLFDKDLLSQGGERNIQNPNQVRTLCQRVHQLPSQPLVLIDQEGGWVCRLKETSGFAPLPSAKHFATLPQSRQGQLLDQSLAQMADLGINIPLAPVIDLDAVADNPDIGRLGRSFSADAKVVEHCALLWAKYATKHKLGLCLKHYPGIGAARVSSHHALLTLPAPSPQQLDLFYALASQIPAQGVLVSHAIVPEWAEAQTPPQPCTLSSAALKPLRQRVPQALLLSDDLQMQGLLRHTQNLIQACIQGLLAGLDGLIIGNNLQDDQHYASALAKGLLQAMRSDSTLARRVEDALARVAHTKAVLFS